MHEQDMPNKQSPRKNVWVCVPPNVLCACDRIETLCTTVDWTSFVDVFDPLKSGNTPGHVSGVRIQMDSLGSLYNKLQQ